MLQFYSSSFNSISSRLILQWKSLDPVTRRLSFIIGACISIAFFLAYYLLSGPTGCRGRECVQRAIAIEDVVVVERSISFSVGGYVRSLMSPKWFYWFQICCI